MLLKKKNEQGKPIVILSREIDNSVDKVIDWLHYFGHNTIFRIKPASKIAVDSVHIANKGGNVFLSVDNRKLDFSNVQSVWIRNAFFPQKINVDSGETNLDIKVSKFLNNEWKFLSDYLIHLLSTKRHLGNYRELAPNKLIQLGLAQKVGLKIPETFIISKNTVGFCTNYITKPMKDIFTFEKGLTGLATKTKALPVLENRTNFFPSLVQDKIEKHFELRTYFFKNKFFSAAIFTGNSSEIDYRSENNRAGLRIVPYVLPIKIKRKLKRLMKHLKVESGSIDMMVTKKMEYVYLEVNPIGYFDNISALCNYNIEKYIAQYLN